MQSEPNPHSITIQFANLIMQCACKKWGGLHVAENDAGLGAGKIELLDKNAKKKT